MKPCPAALATWMLACACAGSLGCSASTGTSGIGGSPGAGGFTAGSGGHTGSGGSGSGGSQAGSGGRGGLGGATATDAGVGDAARDTPGEVHPPPCMVQIKPVFPPNLLELPFGPNARLRVRGVLTGAMLPHAPAWSWTVTTVTNTHPVDVRPDPQDPSTMDFSMIDPGGYDIFVSVSADPACGGHEIAMAASVPSAWYWVRITPPLTQNDVPPHEEAVRLQAGQGLPQRIFSLVGGHGVSLDPYSIDPRTALHQAVPSYVLISSATHTWSREGETQGAAFATSILDRDSGSAVLYEVLVVPLAGGGTLFAPLLFSGLDAPHVAALPLSIDPGASITGNLTVATVPVMGATVALRAGGLPSTIGTSDADGAFNLRARAGRFSAVIVPPDGSLLPQALVDGGPAAGIDLPSAPGAATLGFAWRNLATTSFATRFTTGAGPAAAGLDVRLDSEPDAFPDVGTLEVSVDGVASQSLGATGSVRRATTTDAAGGASFAGLPRGRYRLLAVPPMSSSDSLTVIALDLSGDPAVPAVALVPKVTVSGRLLGAPAGTRLLVLDDQPMLGRTVPAVTLAADGSYALRLDAARAYHLLTDPPAGRRVSRVPLGPIETGGMPVPLGDRTLPGMLSIAGQVFGPDGPMPGATLQLYCMGAGPDCIDDSRLGASEPLPLFETTTDAAGVYTLFAPDPATF